MTSPLVPFLLTHTTVQLVRYMIIFSGEYSSTREEIVGVGKIASHSSQVPSTSTAPAVVRSVYRGAICIEPDGGEPSWDIPGFLEIKVFRSYFLRNLIVIHLVLPTFPNQAYCSHQDQQTDAGIFS